MIRTLAAIGVFASALFAQNKGVINPQHVPPSMMYHHVWAVTPLQGSGRGGDSNRPMFVKQPPGLAQKGGPPAANAPTLPSDRSGVLGYQMQLSDDGHSALVEYVFASPAVFQAVLQQEATARGLSVAAQHSQAPLHAGLAAPSTAQAALEAGVPGLKIFERGKATDTDVLTEFRRHKANYTFNSGTVRPQ